MKDPIVPLRWLRFGQARAYLQMDDNELRRLVKNGTIVARWRKNTQYIDVQDLDKYMLSLPRAKA